MHSIATRIFKSSTYQWSAYPDSVRYAFHVCSSYAYLRFCRCGVYCTISRVLETNSPWRTDKSLHRIGTVSCYTHHPCAQDLWFTYSTNWVWLRLGHFVRCIIYWWSIIIVSQCLYCTEFVSTIWRGGSFSANRIPERISPGTFDYFFASHQIFHFMVVAAALAHYVGCLTSIEHWHGRNAGACLAWHSEQCTPLLIREICGFRWSMFTLTNYEVSEAGWLMKVGITLIHRP